MSATILQPKSGSKQPRAPMRLGRRKRSGDSQVEQNMHELQYAGQHCSGNNNVVDGVHECLHGGRAKVGD